MTSNKITLQGQLKRVQQLETKTDKKSVSAILTFSINDKGDWVDLGYEPVIATDNGTDLATQLEGLANAVVKLSGFWTINGRVTRGQYGLYSERQLRVMEIEVIKPAKVPNTMAENTEEVKPAEEKPEAAPKRKAAATK